MVQIRVADIEHPVPGFALIFSQYVRYLDKIKEILRDLKKYAPALVKAFDQSTIIDTIAKHPYMLEKYNPKDCSGNRAIKKTIPESVKLAVGKYKTMGEIRDILIGPGSSEEKIKAVDDKRVASKTILHKNRDSAAWFIAKIFLSILSVIPSVGVSLSAIWEVRGKQVLKDMKDVTQASVKKPRR